MDTEFLYKANIETLKLIKDEGEKNLASIINADEVITNKSNSLMQILIPLLLILAGFNLDLIFKKVIDYKFYFSLLLIINLTLVIYILYRNILPVKSIMIGAEPEKLLQNDIIFGSDNDYHNVLINRTYNIQKAIDNSIISHKKRYDRFKNANKTLFLGLFAIFCLFLLLQVFRLFLNKC